MPLDHHHLDVYRRALALPETCDQIGRQLPTKRVHVRDQIDRAASSVVANIAEGAGEFSRKEKARYYRMARRSATEIGAWLDIVGTTKGGQRGCVGAGTTAAGARRGNAGQVDSKL